MKKSKKSKKNQLSGSKTAPSAEGTKETTLPEKEGTDTPFDFGGLPNRDLKKNLGCG
jgi:hypothetical protein